LDFELSFEYTPEQQEFRKEVVAWLDANAPKRQADDPAIEPTEEDIQRRIREDMEWQQKLGAKGWLVPTAPKELSGAALPPTQAVVIVEELAKRNLPGGRGPGILAPAIMVHGTEEQKQRFVKPWFEGKFNVLQVFTEPEAGSDLASLRTRGVRDGDEWVVNGSKQFISTRGAPDGAGGQPDWLFTLVNTNPDAPRHENISLFMIDARAPGVTIQRMDQIGMREYGGGQHFVFFDNVRVPHENLIGQEGKGWMLANTTLELEHGGSGAITAAPNEGRAGQLNRVIEYLKSNSPGVVAATA
jgi:alkylation response protein AidB-like acyl-CoA dehydrogenase